MLHTHSLEEDYSYIIMMRKRELLMDRFSPEEMEAVAATTPVMGGSTFPPSFLVLLLQWRSLSPLGGCQERGKFVAFCGCPKIRGFLSLYVPLWCCMAVRWIIP
ncbi:hypothetical protein D1007_07249 [Hordeum vulgare]|nr:hypothetical protein D1007_07249 [Hordeum vulgare]